MQESPFEEPQINNEEVKPIFYSVSATKLIVFSICTFNIYELYWFYKHWEIIKQREHSKISPFWRTIFCPLFCFWLFDEIRDKGAYHSIRMFLPPIVLAIAWIALNSTVHLPEQYWLICLMSVLVLVPVQKTANSINNELAPRHNPNNKITPIQVGATVIGGAIVALAILGTFASGLKMNSVPGVKLPNNMEAYALEYLEKHNILQSDEDLLAYYDATMEMDGTEAAVITTKRVIYHKDGRSSSITLSDISDIRHTEGGFFEGDAFEIDDVSGVTFRIVVFTEGEIFKGVLIRSWENSRQ